jgi:hypothetical protein
MLEKRNEFNTNIKNQAHTEPENFPGEDPPLPDLSEELPF